MAVENAEQFMTLFEQSEELQKQYYEREAAYPGSIEIREYVVEDVLIPFAAEQGFSFTLEDLRKYETRIKLRNHKDVEIDPNEPDDDTHYFLLDHGWTNDESKFCGDK